LTLFCTSVCRASAGTSQDASASGTVDRAAQPVPEAGLFDPEIRAHDRNLGADRDGVALARVEREAQQRRELLDEALGAGGVLGDERGDRVQRIEEEVRVQARLERRQARLGRELLRALALGLQHRAVGDGGIPLGAHRLEDEAPRAHPEAHERRDAQARREQRAAGRGRDEPDPDDDPAASTQPVAATARNVAVRPVHATAGRLHGSRRATIGTTTPPSAPIAKLMTSETASSLRNGRRPSRA
jgi:hypothetical protein